MLKSQSFDINRAADVSRITLEGALKEISKSAFVQLGCGAISEPISARPRYAFKSSVELTGINGVDSASICFLAPDDGTGSTDDKPYLYAKPNHVPRKKSGFAELMIPIGTFYNDHFIPYLVSLEMTTFRRKKILTRGSLVMTPKKYEESIVDVHEDGMTIYETIMLRSTFVKDLFGDPHATRFNADIVDRVNSFYRNWVQVAAFIALPEDNETSRRLVDYSLRSKKEYGVVLKYPN